jgi:FdhD protein
MTKSGSPNIHATRYRPEISNTGLPPSFATRAVDELEQEREVQIAEERPLTIFVDHQEIVTLMTLGTQPELLVLGYLRNQGLVDSLEAITSVQVDWKAGRARVQTVNGRGVMEGANHQHISAPPSFSSNRTFRIRQSQIYELLKNISLANEVYRSAGGVHGCAVCHESTVLHFFEDIGRHNATDTIAGQMWLAGINGSDKCLYSTGRLTSEVVIKAACMNISTLLSRSGISHLGLKVAKDLDLTLIARAKGQHFLIYHGYETILYDVTPKPDTVHCNGTN